MATMIWMSGLNAAVKRGPFFFTHHDIPTKHKPEPTAPCTKALVGDTAWMKINKFYAISCRYSALLTAYKTVKISVCPFRIQTETSRFMIKPKIADCSALKKFMMAVLEYWQGNLMLSLAWIRNHEDQINEPATNANEPIVHRWWLFWFEIGWLAWYVRLVLNLECVTLVKGIPL